MPPTSESGTIGSDEFALATYWDGMDTFWGTSGSVSFSGSSFSGSTDCSQQGVTCSYSTGAMSGSFEFESETLGGGMTWTQVPVSFSNMPTVKLTVSQ
jgi:hypothetical protein